MARRLPASEAKRRVIELVRDLGLDLWIKAASQHPVQPLVHDAKCLLAQAKRRGLVAVVMQPDRLEVVQYEY